MEEEDDLLCVAPGGKIKVRKGNDDEQTGVQPEEEAVSQTELAESGGVGSSCVGHPSCGSLHDGIRDVHEVFSNCMGS